MNTTNMSNTTNTTNLDMLATVACKLLTSQVAGQIAKNGFSAEVKVAEVLNSDTSLRERLGQFRGLEGLGHFRKLKGFGKVDISDGETHIQVKRTKKRQWQQVDRHKLDYYLKHIPQWQKIEGALRGLLEADLRPDGRPDTSTLKCLTRDNYSEVQLGELIQTLEETKLDFLNICLLGLESEKPNIMTAYYPDDKRLSSYHYRDLIKHLMGCQWNYTNGMGKSISLGNILRIKRYGGSCHGDYSLGNQLQVHICPSNLNVLEALEYHIS